MAIWIVISFVCGVICGALIAYVCAHDNARRDFGKRVDE
jgi:hypothetical protein